MPGISSFVQNTRVPLSSTAVKTVKFYNLKTINSINLKLKKPTLQMQQLPNHILILLYEITNSLIKKYANQPTTQYKFKNHPQSTSTRRHSQGSKFSPIG